jgi:hypothetical protein
MPPKRISPNPGCRGGMRVLALPVLGLKPQAILCRPFKAFGTDF